MTNLEMKEKLQEIVESLNLDDAWNREYALYGVRFEDKSREVGDVCECSKHNPDREDERDFPSFDSDEYESLQALDGTSAWELDEETGMYADGVDFRHCDDDDEFWTEAYHCYIVAGHNSVTHDDADAGEVVIEDAVVVEVVF